MGIGVNNLLNTRASPTTAAENVYFGVKAVVKELWSRCEAPIVLSLLFPTGIAGASGSTPESVRRLNHLLVQLGAANPNLHVVDCSHAVLHLENQTINTALMPDYLHPSAKGMARWADCLSKMLDSLWEK